MENDVSGNRLIIFVKNIRLGKVKTRFAATAGDEAALKLYKKLVGLTASQARKTAAECLVSYSEEVEANDIFNISHFEKDTQTGGDLGERMGNAFRKSFQQGYNKVVLIGSDCPGITYNLMNRSFDILDDYDCVLGPSVDGGYYLIGMKRLIPELFENVPWSTGLVLKRTLKTLNRLNYTCELMEELNDIDTAEDLKNSDFSL